MTYVTSLKARVMRSARGELFNPLIYPFLLATFAYGVGFIKFVCSDRGTSSSLFAAMFSISPTLTLIWGILAVLVVIVSFYVLVMDRPPIGKANCMMAWMLWMFAGLVYVLTGGWLPLFAVALPSLYFWTWQYFSLSKFRRQDLLDRATMKRYDEGQYDDKLNPKDGKADREDNRGVDEADRDQRS